MIKRKITDTLTYYRVKDSNGNLVSKPTKGQMLWALKNMGNKFTNDSKTFDMASTTDLRKRLDYTDNIQNAYSQIYTMSNEDFIDKRENKDFLENCETILENVENLLKINLVKNTIKVLQELKKYFNEFINLLNKNRTPELGPYYKKNKEKIKNYIKYVVMNLKYEPVKIDRNMLSDMASKSHDAEILKQINNIVKQWDEIKKLYKSGNSYSVVTYVWGRIENIQKSLMSLSLFTNNSDTKWVIEQLNVYMNYWNKMDIVTILDAFDKYSNKIEKLVKSIKNNWNE